jgi:uncharacterized glyoxalase superfamily protein PhnB
MGPRYRFQGLQSGLDFYFPLLINIIVYGNQNAFGVLVDGEDRIMHAEMTHGDGVIMIGSEWVDWAKSPLDVGCKNTQRIHVRLESGLDEHCERARRAGARIVMEPADQFSGALAAYARSVLLPVSRRRDAWLNAHGPCRTCFRRRTHRSSFGAYRAAYRLGHLGAGPYYGSVTTAGLKHRGDQPSFRAFYDPAASLAKTPQGSGAIKVNYTLPADARAYATRWRVAASLLLHGDRTYMARDPDGHHWTFSQPVRQLSWAQIERDTGFKHKRSA